MSLGSISRPKRISDAQFVGDLMGLFKRHRIESGDAGPASFEACFASKDNFRSQLFTLCTAISHMSDADLSGEELLALIGRALGVPEGSDGTVELPEGMRTAFLTGYEAWSNRDLNEPAPWPPVREPAANEPIPFPQPAEDFAAREEGEKQVPERAPGTRTVQEALLMARKQTPFELPARSAPAPAVNVENLTISELTKLLEDIERRMSRVKPRAHDLNPSASPPDATFERSTKLREFGEVSSSKAAAAAQFGPSLITPVTGGSMSPMEPAGMAVAWEAPPTEGATTEYKEESFLARHSYLKPGRRLPPDTIVPMPVSFTVVPAPPPVELPKAEILAPPSPPVAVALDPVAEPDRFRIKIHVAITIIAALVLVASPLAGFVVYRLLHPTYVIDYRDVTIPVEPDTGTPAAAPSPNPTPPAVAPASSPTGKSTSPKANSASGSKAAHSAAHTTKRTDPVAVWPPAPQK